MENNKTVYLDNWKQRTGAGLIVSIGVGVGAACLEQHCNHQHLPQAPITISVSNAPVNSNIAIKDSGYIWSMDG
jgi:hypothetical protein